MRIVHISDVHIGDADAGLLQAATAAIGALAPDVVALSGDVTQSGRAREFSAAAQFLRSLPAPIVATPGNHDAPVFHPLLRMIDPYGRFKTLPASCEWDAPDGAGAVRQIATARAIQSRRDWSQGAYDLAALRRALSGPPGWLFLVAHHPPGTFPGARVRSDARRAEAARALIGARPRTVLLAGHAHGFCLHRFNAAGSALIVAPSLASGRPRAGGHGFVEIDAGPAGLSAILHTFDGAQFRPALQAELAAA
ncbi:MAG: metallophosphoesterase [Hyphomonadaceae bacterium]|nr:metallophosphoesterase [Hyphomonadaceae bacterium]